MRSKTICIRAHRHTDTRHRDIMLLEYPRNVDILVFFFVSFNLLTAHTLK